MTLTSKVIEYLSPVGAKVSTRSLLRKLAALVERRPSFIALADQGVVSATNFGTGIIIGRVCGKAELGAYALAWTLMTVSTESSATLTTTPYTVFGPQLTHQQRGVYLGSILVHQVLFSIAFALTLVAGAVVGSRLGWMSQSLSSVIATTGCAITFIGLREFARRVSFAELKVGSAFVIDAIVCVAQAAGLLLLLHFVALTASRTYIVIGITSASVGGGWLALHWRALHVDARLCVGDVKRNWQFAKWVLGSWMVAAVGIYLYPWLLTAFHGTSATGIWAACSAVVALGNPVVLGLSNHVGPQIHNVYASSGTAAMQQRVNRSSLQFAALLMPLLLVLAVCGERIVTGIYGMGYAGSSAIVTLLAFNMLISAVTFPYARGLFSLECAKADMLVNVVAVVLLFVIGVAAVKWYAVIGAAAALLASSAVTTIIRIGVFAREIHRRTTGSPMGAPHLAIEPGDL